MLLETLQSYRRQLAGLRVRHIAEISLTCVLTTSVIAGLLDWYLRPEVPIARWALTTTTLLPGIVVAVWALRDCVFNFGNLSRLTQPIEIQDPFWEGRLRAATVFAGMPTHCGSSELKQQTIVRAEADLLRHPLPPLRTPTMHRLWRVLAAVLLVFLGGVGLLRADVIAIGVQRLLLPSTEVSWPRAVSLELLTPDGRPLARYLEVRLGESLNFRVTNRHGDLPDDLRLEVDGQTQIPKGLELNDEVAGNGVPESVLVAIAATEQEIRFRLVGGDDFTMRDYRLRGRRSPRVAELTLRISPPDYTGERSRVISPVRGQVSVPVGSRIGVSIATGSTVTAAQLWLPTLESSKVALEKKSLKWEGEVRLDQPGPVSLRFALQDERGLITPATEVYELVVRDDLPPRVTLTSPSTDLRCTPMATLPIRIEFSDDYGLTDTAFHWTCEDNSGPSAPSSTPPMPSPDEGRTILSDGLGSREATSELSWDLAPLQLAPGERLIIGGEAQDGTGRQPAQIGRSELRTIVIVSPEELADEVARRFGEIVGQMKAGGIETNALIAELKLVIDDINRQPLLDGEISLRLTAATRRIGAMQKKFSQDHEGLIPQLHQLQEEAIFNRLPPTQLLRQIADGAQKIDRIGDQTLPKVASQVEEASRLPQSPAEAESKLQNAITDLEMLSNLIESMVREHGARQLRTDGLAGLRDLIRSQKELTIETSKLSGETLGISAGQLTPSQMQVLKRLAVRQDMVANGLRLLASEIVSPPPIETQEALPSIPPAFIQSADQLQTEAVPRARLAATLLEGNDLGEAGQQQRDLNDTLLRIFYGLGGEKESNPGSTSAPTARPELPNPGAKPDNRDTNSIDDDLNRDEVAQTLASWADQQQRLNGEAAKLFSQSVDGRFSRSQLIKLRNLAAAQRSLEDECRTSLLLESSKILTDELGRCAGLMHKLAVAVESRAISETTLTAGVDAEQKLRQMVDALGAPPNAARKPAPTEKSPGQKQQQSDRQLAAELRLLRAMQDDLLTQTLGILGNSSNLPPSEKVEVVTQEQKRLRNSLSERIDDASAGELIAASPDSPAGLLLQVLDQAVTELREVRLKEATESQQQVLGQIDRLLESPRAESSTKPAKANSADDPATKPSPSSKSPESRSSENVAMPDTPAQQDDGQASGNGSGSEMRSDGGQATLKIDPRSADGIAAEWGHLPPRLRDQLLNTGDEKMLPRYEALSQKYYEELASPELPAASR